MRSPELRGKSCAVVLKSQGGGRYTGAFPGTDVEGAYSVVFEFAGSRPDIGVYHRTGSVSTVVQFGNADLAASSVKVTPIGATTTERQFLLSLRPKDRFGNYLGPGYADRINVSVSPGSVGDDKKDLGDGGYTVALRAPQGSNPNLGISVMNRDVFNGLLSDRLPRLFALSLHGGLSLPHGSFNSTYDNGFGFTADVERRLNNTLSLQGLGGFHHFDRTGSSAHLNTYHVSLGLEAFHTSNAILMSLNAGGGAYFFNPGSTDLGVHAGAGLELQVSPSLGLGTVYRLHTVFSTGSNRTFSAVQVGGHVRF